MSRTLSLLVALLATLLAGCGAPAPRADGAAADAAANAPAKNTRPIFDFPMLERELDNGLKVIVVKTPQKGVVSLQIPVQTGSRNEVEQGKTGFAHFFEHMMFRGTPSYPADAYGAVMKAAGADQNAYTDEDFTNYYVNFTPEDLDIVLKVEADRFQNLAYTEAQFRTEALAVKGEYLKNSANPIVKAFERLQALSYTTHTYRHTGMGTFEDIEDMPNELEYSHQFFDRWYRPEHTTVILAGDLDLEDAAAKVEQYFGSWKRGSWRAEVPVEPAPSGPKSAHIAWEGPTLPWMLVAWRAPAWRADTPDSAALALLGEAYFGEASPIYQKLVVKERKADQFFYAAPRNRDPGLFVIGVRLSDAAHAGAVSSAIADAVAATRTPLDAGRFEATRSRMKYGFAAGLDSAASIGAILATYVHYERRGSTLNEYSAQVDALAPSDLVDVAGRVFTDANRSLVTLAQAPALEGAEAFAASGAALAPAPYTAEPAEAPAPDETDGVRLAVEELRYTTRIIEQPAPSPLVDVALVVKAGAAYDPPGKRGLAALTAAMIAEGGTALRRYEEIQESLYPLSASLDWQVDKETVRLAGTVHRDNAERWWATVSEQLYDPGFREEDFARLKQQHLNAIRVSLRASNDEELAKELLYEQVYGPEHPYGTLNIGHAKELESITLEDVRGFYRSHYGRPKLTLGLAGGYDPGFASRLAGSLMRLPYLRQAPEVVATPATPAAARDALIVDKASASAYAVSFGVPHAVRRGHPDWPALYLARSWLGEHRNSSAHLYNRIRELRGMNYGDYAYIEYFPFGMFRMQPEPGYARRHDLFQVWLRPLRDANDAHFATRVAVHELEKLVREGISQEAFEATRTFLRKQALVLTATQRRQLGYALDDLFHGTPPFAEYVRESLGTLDKASVDAALKRHVALDGLKFVIVGPKGEELAKRLAADTPSPITYNSEKPAELVAEDKVIAKLPLRLSRERIRVVDDEAVLE